MGFSLGIVWQNVSCDFILHICLFLNIFWFEEFSLELFTSSLCCEQLFRCSKLQKIFICSTDIQLIQQKTWVFEKSFEETIYNISFLFEKNKDKNMPSQQNCSPWKLRLFLLCQLSKYSSLVYSTNINFHRFRF